MVRGIAGISFCGLQKETVWINYFCLDRLLPFAVLLTGQGEQGIEWVRDSDVADLWTTS